MRLRLVAAAGVDMRARIPELTPKQLVALRFAGDAERPGLVGNVAGKVTTQKAIGLQAKNWQAD